MATELEQQAALFYREAKPPVEQARFFAGQGIACAPISLDGRYGENPTTNAAAFAAWSFLWDGPWGAVLPDGRGLLLSNGETDLRLRLRREQLGAANATRSNLAGSHSFPEHKVAATFSAVGNAGLPIQPSQPEPPIARPVAPTAPTFNGGADRTPEDDALDAEYQRELAADSVAPPVAVPVALKASTERLATTASDVSTPDTTSTEQLYNVSTVAKRAHLSRQAVLRRLNGTKTHFRVGTAPLFTHEELEQFVAQHGNGKHD